MKIHLLIQSTKSNGQATRWVGRADLHQTVAMMPAQAHEKLSVEVRLFPDDAIGKPPATRRLTARRVGDDLVLEWGDLAVLRVVDFYRTPGAELGELELSQAAPGAHWAGPVAEQNGTQTDVSDTLSERLAASPGASLEGGVGAATASVEVTLVPVLLPVPNLLPGILGLAGLAAVGSGGSGAENVSQGTTPAVFIVRFDAVASTVSFEGAVTGDISVAVSAGSASFERGGVKAETTVSGLFNLDTAPLIKLASGQNLIVKGADIHNQSIRVEGSANAYVTIQATDAGPTEITHLSAVVKVSLKGGTLTFDMTDNQQDTFTLLAHSAIDLAGGTLVVSDGIVDARNVPLTQLTNIGNIILNSELVVTLAQFDGLYEKLDVAKSQGDLVLAIAPTEVTEAATVATLNNIRAGAITKTTVSIEALTSDGASAVAAALVQKLAPTATVVSTDTGVQRLDRIEALQATLGTDRKLDISKVAALEGTPEQIEQIFSSVQVIGSESKPVIVLEAQPLSVDAVNALAQRTGGRVTATISTGLMSELAALDASNGTAHAYKIKLTDTEVDAGALRALYGKTSEAVNAESVTTLTGSAEDVVAVYQSSGEVTGLGNIVVHVTGEVSAATANTIAGLTEGAVTATVGADTAAALKAALKNASAADVLTLTVSAGAAAAADLITLAGKTSVAVEAKAVTAVTGNADQITALYALDATDIAGLGNEAVHVTGEVSAATANTIAGLTEGVVTATVGADTAANLKAALKNASAADVLTLTVSVREGTTAAADLLALAGMTSVAVDAKAVTAVTGNADQIAALYALDTTDISGLGNEAVHVTGEVSAATANTIAGLTEGAVTATVAADTAENLKTALSNASATDALTLTVSDGTDPTAAADLITLAGKTTVAVNALKVTSLSGTSTFVAAVLTSTKISTSETANSIDVSLTDTITVAQANGLNADAAVDQITATISEGSMNALAALEVSNGTAHAYRITLTDTEVDAGALKALYGKARVSMNAESVTTLRGSAADVVAVYQSSGEVTGLGKEAISVSGVISAEQAAAIATRTSGQVTATVDLNLGEGSFDDKVTALLDALTASGSVVPEVNAFVFRHLPSDASETSLAKLQSLSSLEFDRTRPSLEIVTTLGADTTANGDVTYVFSFDEAVVDFDKNDITVLNGEKGLFTATTEGEQANRRFTLVVKPTPDTQGQFIRLTVGTDWTDLAGNAPAGVSTAPLQPFDTLAPGLKITSDYDTLNGDEEAQVTFTFQFTESVSDFDKSDIDVVGGKLGLLTGSGTTYTATFTPEANFEGTARISVSAGGFTDTAGNANTLAASHILTVDTRAPTLSIRNDQAPGSTAKGQMTYTFTFSEAVSGFDIDDITVNGGTPLELVSTTTGPDVDKVYTLVIVPTAGTATGTLEVSVGNGWSDKFGNRPALASTSATPQAYDTLPPTGVVGSLKVTADNTVNSDESRQDTLTVTGQVTGEFTVGNSVFITVNGQTYQDMVDDTDGNFSVNVAVSDLLDAATGTTRSLSATAVLTDAAGNRFTTPEVTHSFAVDMVAPVITSATTKLIRERADSVLYTGTSTAADFDHWDLVRGLDDHAHLLQVNPRNGQVTLQGGGDLIYGQNDSQYKFTLRAFDKAGNHSDQAVTVNVLDLPEVSLTNLQVGGEDNIVNAEESSGDEVRVTATIKGSIASRTTYTVESVEAVLEIDDGASFPGEIKEDRVIFLVPKAFVLEGHNAVARLSLTIKDDLTVTGSHSVSVEPIAQEYTVDTALIGDVVDVKVTADNVINVEEFSVREGEELIDTLTVTGQVTGEFAKNDLVTLSFDGPNYTGRVDEEGRFSIEVLKVDVRGNSTRSVTVSVERHDGAGNVGTTTFPGHAYTFDVESPLVTLNALSTTAVSDSTPTVTGRVTDRSTGMARVVVTLTVFDQDGNALSGSAFTGLSVTTDDFGNFSKELPTLPASGNYRVVASTAATDAAGNPALSGEVTAIYKPVTISATGTYGLNSSVDENTAGWQLNLVTDGGAAGATYSLQMEIDPLKSPDLSKFTLSGNTLVFRGSTNYEAYGSADGDNTYQITLHAEDGKGNSVDQVVRFSLNNLGPVFKDFMVPTVALTSSNTSASVILAPGEMSVAVAHYQLDHEDNAGAGWTSWVGGAMTPLADFVGAESTISLGGALGDSRSLRDLLTFYTKGVEGGLELHYTLNSSAIDYKALSLGESLSVPISLWVNTTESGAANGEVTRLQVPVLLRGVNDAPTVVDLLAAEGEVLTVDPSTFTFDDVAHGTGAVDWDDSTDGNLTADIAHFRVTEVLAGTLFVGELSYGVGAALPVGGLRIDRDSNLSWKKAVGSTESGPVAAFMVVAVDHQEAVSNSSATVYVEVQGQNAVITPVGDQFLNVTEDDESNFRAYGTLSVDDPDDGERLFLPPTAEALAGRYSNFLFDEDSGAWSYELDMKDPDTNALSKGQQVEDSLTVYSADGTPYTLRVNVTGSNDAATFSHKDTPDLVVYQGGSTLIGTAGGTLSVDDIDAGENAFQSVADSSLIQTYGNFTFNASTGAWTYALDESRPATMDLNEGASVEDRLTVQSYDGTPFDIVVSVRKTFAPVNTVPEVTTAEDTPVAIIGLHVTDEDADVTGIYTVYLTVTNGTLAVASTVAGGLGTTDIAAHNDEGIFAVTLTGTLAAINTTLSATNGVTFHPAENFFSTEANPAVLTITTNDGAGGMSTSGPVLITVTEVNDKPLGTPSITGIAKEDEILMVSHDGITDADGMVRAKFSYSWLRNGETIDGADGATYRLGDADVGQTIIAQVHFEDDVGHGESVKSASLGPIANINDLPTGQPAISYTPAVAGARPSVGQVLTASTGTTEDADGLGKFAYQWLRAGEVIEGATSSTYTLVSADAGSAISVRAEYTDGHGTAETVDSLATAAVNILPTTATGPVTSNTGTEDTVVVVSFANIQSALGATDSDGTVAKFTVGSVTTGSLKIGATSESAMAFSSTNNAITADLNAYWTPGKNLNDLRNMFTVRAVDNDGATSSLVQLRATLASVNDAPGMSLVTWDDYSSTPYDPTDPSIAGNPVAYLMSGGAFPTDPENNPITRIKIVVTYGLDSVNDRLEVAAKYSDGNVPNLSVSDNISISQYDPDATFNEVGPGELILTARAGVSISNSTWSEFLQFVVLRSQPGAAAGDRVFAIEVTDAPGGTLTPLTTVVTSQAGKPFVVTVAASSAPEPASEAPVAQSAGWGGVDGHDPLAGLLPSSSDYVLSGTPEPFATFSMADATPTSFAEVSSITTADLHRVLLT